MQNKKTRQTALSFGRYKGITLSDALRINPSYIGWLIIERLKQPVKFDTYRNGNIRTKLLAQLCYKYKSSIDQLVDSTDPADELHDLVGLLLNKPDGFAKRFQEFWKTNTLGTPSIDFNNMSIITGKH